MEDFTVTVRQDDAGVHLFLAGELDAVTAPVFEAAAENAFISRSPVTLDLSHLEFIDSSGLSVLVTMQKRALNDGTKMTLCAPSDRFLRLLEVTALDDYFDLSGT